MEMESVKPQKEHEFLSRLVGDWVMVAGHEDTILMIRTSVLRRPSAPSAGCGSSAKAPAGCLTATG
jgi:hypothetical protein